MYYPVPHKTPNALRYRISPQQYRASIEPYVQVISLKCFSASHLFKAINGSWNLFQLLQAQRQYQLPRYPLPKPRGARTQEATKIAFPSPFKRARSFSRDGG